MSGEKWQMNNKNKKCRPVTSRTATDRTLGNVSMCFNNSIDSKPVKLSVTRPDGRPIGTVTGQTFNKTIRATHFLEKPPAIAFSSQSLADAKAAGASLVRVTCSDTGITYTAALDTILKRGRPMARGGYEHQTLLTLNH